MTIFENELTLPFDTNIGDGKTRKLFIIQSFGPHDLYASIVEDNGGFEVDWIGEVSFKSISMPIEGLNNSLKARGCISDLSEEQVSVIEEVYVQMLTAQLDNAFSFDDDKHFEYDGEMVYYLSDIDAFNDRLVQRLTQRNRWLETPFTERQLLHIGDAVLLNIPCERTMGWEDDEHITLPCNFTVNNEFTDCYTRALEIHYKSIISGDTAVLAACAENDVDVEDICRILSTSPESLEKQKESLEKRLTQAKWTVEQLEIE